MISVCEQGWNAPAAPNPGQICALICCPASSSRSTSMQQSAPASCMWLECAFKPMLPCRFGPPHRLPCGHGRPCCQPRQLFEVTQHLHFISQAQCSCSMLALVISCMCSTASGVQNSSSRKTRHSSFGQRDSHFPPIQKREARRRFTKVLLLGLELQLRRPNHAPGIFGSLIDFFQPSFKSTLPTK